RTLNRHGPQGQFGAFLDARGTQQGPGFFRVVRCVLDAGVIGPLGRWHGVDCQLPRALVNRVDDGFLVDGHVQRLTHFQLAQRFVAHVVGDVAEVETWLLDNLQAFVFLELGEVCRTRVDRHLALVGLELLHARRGVGHD
ncbi:hypothetical protein APX70_03592, partial [Pseudomonas syringae pv. maculicola]